MYIGRQTQGNAVMCAVISECLLLRVKLTQSLVFCANPDLAILILYNFPYDAPMQGALLLPGIEFVELQRVVGVIIDAAKISARPDTPFFILTKRIDGIVTKRILVGCYLL